ncbi:MAG: hypothetical protein U9Q16_02455, partial [Patescibacteria group bacterium]|nr:hypothetical protein [Patescibacteria group bacterium]
TKERFIMNKMKPIDYENIPKSTLKNLKNMDAIISTATGSHIQKLIDSQGSSAARSIERATKSLAALNSTKTGIHITASEYILKENPKLHKYLTSGGGRGLINI